MKFHRSQLGKSRGARNQHSSPMTTTQISSQVPQIDKSKGPARRRSNKNNVARITRILIEKTEMFNGDEIRPRLKSGVHISQAIAEQESSLVVAASQTAISISHPGARSIIAKFDGQRSAAEISDEINAPISVIRNVISELVSAQLIDLTKSKIKLQNRFQSPIAERASHNEDQSNDAFFRQLQLRMAPELSQTTWIENIIDGGVERLSARQNFGIEIHGGNRLATLIYVGLLASGVSQTKFSITSRRENYSIGDCDLGTGVIRVNDFGLNYKARIEELSREWSLFPTASKNVKGSRDQVIPEKNLRIIVGNFPQELVDQLMRDEQEHLFIGGLIGGAAHCGPLVIPKRSPCINCVELARADQYGIEQLVALNPMNDEPPVAIAYQLAGAAIQAVLQFIDTGKCELLASRLTFDYLAPARQEPIRFSRHPRCTCVWSEPSLSTPFH